MKIIKSNKNDYLNYKSFIDFKNLHKNFSEINNIFEGRTIAQLTCSETGGIKTNFESFFYLTLAIPTETNTNINNYNTNYQITFCYNFIFTKYNYFKSTYNLDRRGF